MIEGGDAQNPNGHISNSSPDSAAAGLSSTDLDPMRRRRGDPVRIAGFPQKGNRHWDLSCGGLHASEIDAAVLALGPSGIRTLICSTSGGNSSVVTVTRGGGGREALGDLPIGGQRTQRSKPIP
jgi:hypothetical protein